MEKINGFYKDEVERLISFLSEGKRKGVCLSKLFEEYGKRYGRAKGSVRNFYYQLLKERQRHGEIDKLLRQSNLKAEKILEFSEDETVLLVREILKGRAKGQSVRGTIRALSKGDGKLMLRMQNKYRNILKSRPDIIEKQMMILKEELGQDFFKAAQNAPVFSDFAIKRLQREINSLYNKLSESLKRENRTLKEKLMRLEGENLRLKVLCEDNVYKEKNKSRIFFDRGDSKHIIN